MEALHPDSMDARQAAHATILAAVMRAVFSEAQVRTILKLPRWSCGTTLSTLKQERAMVRSNRLGVAHATILAAVMRAVFFEAQVAHPSYLLLSSLELSDTQVYVP